MPQVFAAHDVREAIATLSLNVQQPWDPGMLSLAFEAPEGESAVATQYHLYGLAKHLFPLQLRGPQRQSTITAYVQVDGIVKQLHQNVVAPSRPVGGAGTAAVAAPGFDSADIACIYIYVDCPCHSRYPHVT